MPAVNGAWDELVQYIFERENGSLVILALLDRIRVGSFVAVMQVPPAATWLRVRQCVDETQVPLWSRS